MKGKTVAVVLAMATAALTWGIQDAMSTQLSQNQFITVDFRVDKGILTVDISGYGDNFGSVYNDRVVLYNRDNLNVASNVNGFAISGNEATVTLSQSMYEQFKDVENMSIKLFSKWAKFDDGRWIPTGNNPVTRTHLPPTITAGSYNTTNGAIEVTIDKKVKKANAGSICIAAEIVRFSGTSTLTKCATSVSVSGNSTTANVKIGPEDTIHKIGSMTLEVSKYAIQSTNDAWNAYGYSKTYAPGP